MDHSTHLLVQKEKYSLKSPQIEASFGSLENMLEKDDLFANLKNKRKELIDEMDNTCKKIAELANEWKEKKTKIVNELFDELETNIEELNIKKFDCKKVLNNFGEKHRKFFSLGEQNKDPHNAIFLINYDLLSIPYLWSDQIAKLGKEIENHYLEYKTNEENKNQDNLKKIKEILFLSDDEDPITHEKIDEKFLPLVKLKVGIKDFNADKLKDIDKRIHKYNKGIDGFKNSVLNSISKHGNYKELAKENNIYEHR